MEETGASLVVLSCLPELFLDEDIENGEAHQLFLRSMRAIRKTVDRHGAVGLATNAGLTKLYRRKAIRRVLYEGVDRVVRMAHGHAGVLISRPEAGISEWYRPAAPNQSTLDDFALPEPRILGLVPVETSRELRPAGHLRIAW